MSNPLNLTKFSFTLFVLLWALAIGGLFLVPLDAPTPIHWNINGEPDGFAPGWVSVLLPAIIATLVLAFITLISHAVSQENYQAGRAGIERAKTILLLVSGVVALVIILNALGQDVPVPKTVAFLIAGVLIALGDILPKSQPNSLSGIRLPHTMNNADVWRITHRWAGRIMIIAGVLLALATFFIHQTSYLLVAIFGAVLIPLALSIVISYRVAKANPS